MYFYVHLRDRESSKAAIINWAKSSSNRLRILEEVGSTQLADSGPISLRLEVLSEAALLNNDIQLEVIDLMNQARQQLQDTVSPSYSSSGRGGGGVGVLQKKSGRGVRPASQNPYFIYDQNLRFSLPYL